MEWKRRDFIASLPLMIGACATVDQTRYREGDNRGQAVNMTVLDEERMAKEVQPEMEKQFPPVRDYELQRYVSGLGQRVVAASDLGGNPYNYSFTLVDSPQINAFALPAGPVYITLPLLALADTEAELAGVIGHEIGHVKARHAAERIYRVERSKGKSIAYLLGGGVIGGILGYGLGRLICGDNSSACTRAATKFGATLGAGGGILVSKFGFMANSREDEFEADRVAFRTAVKAGYDKNYVGNFYEKLMAMEEERKGKRKSKSLLSFTDALSTHPPSNDRLNQMKQLARESIGLGKGKVSSREFDRVRRQAVEMVT